MGTIRQRHLYSFDGERFSYRDASEYVTDPRDLQNFKPPAWHQIFDPVKKLDSEIEFDHIPSDQELRAAFKERDDGEQVG